MHKPILALRLSQDNDWLLWIYKGTTTSIVRLQDSGKNTIDKPGILLNI
jgi:hypothetical protein